MIIDTVTALHSTAATFKIILCYIILYYIILYYIILYYIILYYIILYYIILYYIILYYIILYYIILYYIILYYIILYYINYSGNGCCNYLKKCFIKKNNCIIISIIIKTLNILLYICSDIICCNYTVWFQPKADRHSKCHYVLFYIIILCYYVIILLF